jgi:hypothetical protein
MRTFRERRIILDIRWGLSGDTLVFIKIKMLSLFGGGGLYYDYQTTIALNIIFMVGLVQLVLFIALVILLVVRSKLRQKVTTNPEPPSTIT